MTAPSPPKAKGWLRLVTVPVSLLLILATIVAGQEIIRGRPTTTPEAGPTSTPEASATPWTV